MTDLAAVKKALDPDLIGFDGQGNITLPREAFEAVHAAARSYVRLVEKGPDYKAAEALFDKGSDLEWLNSNRLAVDALVRRIVGVALADYLTEETG